jgi:hypothetical protein
MHGGWGTVRREIRNTLKSFLVELAVYAALVTVYFLLVLHLLGGWLYGLFEHDRRLYAWLAVLLIVAQGLLLETLTRALIGWVKPRNDAL